LGVEPNYSIGESVEGAVAFSQQAFQKSEKGNGDPVPREGSSLSRKASLLLEKLSRKVFSR
jgi:hypothetical protein